MGHELISWIPWTVLAFCGGYIIVESLAEQLKKTDVEGRNRTRWIRTSKDRGHSIFINGGAEFPDYYLTLQEKVYVDHSMGGRIEWKDVPIINE